MAPATPERKKRKLNHEYSSNANTIKNIARRDSLQGYPLAVHKGKAAFQTAYSRFWKDKFNPAAQQLLSECTEADRQSVWETLRAQAKNALVCNQWESNSHWAQKISRDYPSEPVQHRNSFITAQSTIYPLGDKFTPPTDAFITITSTITQPLPEIEVHEKFEQLQIVEPSAEDDEIDLFLPDLTAFDHEDTVQTTLALSTSHVWFKIQVFWERAIVSVGEKMEFLRKHSYNAFVRRLSQRQLKFMINRLIPGMWDIVKKQVADLRAHDKSTLLRLAYEHSPVPGEKLQRSVPLEAHSELPVMPFWCLFNKPERIIMAAFFKCQMGGKYTASKIPLAVDGHPAPLPHPYSNCTISDPRQAKMFPLERFDAMSGSEFIHAIVSHTRNPPSEEKIGMFMDGV
ncbi:hypothetical protein NX059_012339 [Plenodomus lindquistii]|nr:hypothetical protein NX059_012339 [Plenodomus lindquistii]